MALDDALNDGEPNPRPLKFFRFMKPLKNTKQLMHVLHVKTYPIIVDPIRDLISIPVTAYFDLGHLPVARIFQGIRD